MIKNLGLNWYFNALEIALMIESNALKRESGCVSKADYAGGCTPFALHKRPNRLPIISAIVYWNYNYALLNFKSNWVIRFQSIHKKLDRSILDQWARGYD